VPTPSRPTPEPSAVCSGRRTTSEAVVAEKIGDPINTAGGPASPGPRLGGGWSSSAASAAHRSSLPGLDGETSGEGGK
jgi:hypothetical protein